MSDSNYNFEQEIKKQIEAREITPIRDLWSEIESQKKNDIPLKSKVNLLLIAACFILIAGLSVVLFFNNDKKIEPQMVETQIQPQKSKVEKELSNDIFPIKSEKSDPYEVKNNVVVAEKIEKSKPTSVVEKVQVPLQKETEEQIASETRENIISNANILAATDSIKIPKKRKKYVDASTLLFSVEHKDVIENSKDGSNVATIDLSSK